MSPECFSVSVLGMFDSHQNVLLYVKWVCFIDTRMFFGVTVLGMFDSHQNVYRTGPQILGNR